MRQNIRNGSMNFRRAYLRSIIDRIEVDDETVRIYGDSSTLEQAIAGERRVRAFEQRWRALRDSNS
ncbi:MAG: hypothetical protein P4M09_14665 [Devosia sp.]|nr:hypothetical protein [Devosia sp.]